MDDLGYVYIAASSSDVNKRTWLTGYHNVKIGKTINPRQRLKTYKTWDQGIVYLCVYKCVKHDMGYIESTIHKILRDHGCQAIHDFTFHSEHDGSVRSYRPSERFNVKNITSIVQLMKNLDHERDPGYIHGKYLKVDKTIFPKIVKPVTCFDRFFRRCR